jgi:hypothetical protein
MASNTTNEYATAEYKVIADMIVSPDEDILVNIAGGVYMSSITPVNKLATVTDVGVETAFTVVGGTAGTQPTFTGAPLFSGSYIKTVGGLVHFRITVDFDNITGFGTGQYYVTLPFPAKYDYKFRDGAYADISESKEYTISGHVSAGSSTLQLFTTDTQSGRVFDVPFTATSPVTLTTADDFHIAGNYIMQEPA